MLISTALSVCPKSKQVEAVSDGIHFKVGHVLHMAQGIWHSWCSKLYTQRTCYLSKHSTAQTFMRFTLLCHYISSFLNGCSIAVYQARNCNLARHTHECILAQLLRLQS